MKSMILKSLVLWMLIFAVISCADSPQQSAETGTGQVGSVPTGDSTTLSATQPDTIPASNDEGIRSSVSSRTATSNSESPNENSNSYISSFNKSLKQAIDDSQVPSVISEKLMNDVQHAQDNLSQKELSDLASCSQSTVEAGLLSIERMKTDAGLSEEVVGNLDFLALHQIEWVNLDFGYRSSPPRWK